MGSTPGFKHAQFDWVLDALAQQAASAQRSLSLLDTMITDYARI